MPDISHRQTHGHEHKNIHRLSADLIQLQRLTLSHHHDIEQRIAQELSQNPALQVEEEPDFLENIEPEERDDDWNEDYDKPQEEYETGESSTSKDTTTWDAYDIPSNLEQSATQRFIEDPDALKRALACVDYYRIHGSLPDDAAPQLHEDLEELEKSVAYPTLPFNYPTFEVTVEDDRVEAHAFPVGTNLRYIQGIRRQSSRAKRFIKLLQERNKLLNELAYYVLEMIQGDFFRQDEFEKALCHLITLSTVKLRELPISCPFKLDTKYFSKLGDHLVSCRFGTLPLNFFLQEKAQVVRLWVHFAENEGKFTKKEQFDWIKKQIKERVEEWDLSDIRQKYILPLKSITTDDIKYARRIHKNAL